MSRALIVIRGEEDKRRAASWAMRAPSGCRIEFKQTKRSLPQNDLMWAMLTDIAIQKEHGGRKYKPSQWKTIFMHALGEEVQFIPSLDEKTFIPWGDRSSDLSREEMSNLIEFIYSWGAANGVIFHEPQHLEGRA